MMRSRVKRDASAIAAARAAGTTGGGAFRPTGIDHGSSAVTTTLREAPPPRRQRLLEDERWLAFVLLVPTMVLLGMFIAYPFVRGIMLSVTSSRVGVPGDFVGLDNYVKIWNDAIFRTAVYNTFLYTGVTTVFKLALGLWLAHAAQPPFQGQGVHPRLHPAALHHPDRAVDLRLEVDVRSDLQRHQLDACSSSASSPAASTGWAIPTWRWSRSSSSTSGAACRSSPSPCWPACRPSAPSCTRRRPSTAPSRGSASGTSPGRCCCR